MPCSQSLVGNQTPRIRVAQPYKETEGNNAIKVAKILGITFDPWQTLVIRDWLAVDSNGKYVHTRCGLELPRQNGKTLTVENRIIYGSLFKGERILYTAHDYSTVTQLFDRLQVFFGEKSADDSAKYPDINKRVSMVRRAAGKEAVFLKNGGAIYLSTRTKTARRGFTVDVVIYDEAQELTEEQMKASMSTASSPPLKNPQYLFLGTPPGPESNGVTFQHIRDKVLEGNETDITWSEWSVDKVDDVTDERLWYETNPALGTRLDIDVIRAELGTFTDPLSFAQERLGYWLEVGVDTVIGKEQWNALAVKKAPKEGKIAYGIKFSPKGDHVTLAAAIKPKTGKPHVEVICTESMRRGVTWLVEWLCARKGKCSTVVIDGFTGSSNLITRLNGKKFPKMSITEPKTENVIASSSMFLDMIDEGAFTHANQPGLNDSALYAQKRIINKDAGKWGWGGENSTPIEAASLALWGVMTTKRNPNRKKGPL